MIAHSSIKRAGFIPAHESNQRIPLTLFFVFLFLCWIGTLPMILTSHGKEFPGVLKLLQLIMLFGPGLVAVICTWTNEGRSGVRDLFARLFRWRVHPGWYALALILPPLAYAVALLISNATGQTSMTFPPASTFFSSFLLTLGIYALLNTEELAWRGYALPRLQSRIGLMPATLVIGVLWTVFHLPLFWMKGGHPAGYPFWLFTSMVMSISILFSAAYLGAGQSLLIVHLLHQTLNASVEALPVYPRSAQSNFPVLLATVMLFAVGMVLLARHGKLQTITGSLKLLT